MNHQPIDPNLPWVVLCDLDGTLALRHPDRLQDDYSTCGQDLPNGAVVDVLQALWLRGSELVFLTCRSRDWKDQTEAFIGKYLTCPSEKFTMSKPDYQPIEHALIMRDPGDSRSSADIKRDMYETYVRGQANVRCVLEDDPGTVAMFRGLGLTVFDVGQSSVL